MKCNQKELDLFYTELDDVLVKDSIVTTVPNEVYKYAKRVYEPDMLCLYYPDLYVLPIDEDGERYLNYLYTECLIGCYGAYEQIFKYKDETYIAVIVNND